MTKFKFSNSTEQNKIEIKRLIFKSLKKIENNSIIWIVLTWL